MPTEHGACILSVGDVIELRLKARAYALVGIDKLSDYSDTRLAAVYNGVGPDWFPAKLRDSLSRLNKRILPAVLVHDIDYDSGGTKAEFLIYNRNLGINSEICIEREYAKWSLQKLFAQWRVKRYVKLCDLYVNLVK